MKRFFKKQFFFSQDKNVCHLRVRGELHEHQERVDDRDADAGRDEANPPQLCEEVLLQREVGLSFFVVHVDPRLHFLQP